MCGGVSSAAQWFGGTTAMWTLTYKLKIWTISSCLRDSPGMCGGVSSAAQWFGGTTAMWTLTYKLWIWTISSCSTVCCSSGFNVRRNNPEHLW